MLVVSYDCSGKDFSKTLYDPLRFGYFVMKQPRALDYAAEGGPTDSCSPNMSNGRGPRYIVLFKLSKGMVQGTGALNCPKKES